MSGVLGQCLGKIINWEKFVFGPRPIKSKVCPTRINAFCDKFLFGLRPFTIKNFAK